MIILEGFNAGNFDLWVLLNKYKIPSMMISKKEFTYRNKTVMVCWKPEEQQAQEYAIIMVPVFYKKKKDEENENKDKDKNKEDLNQYKLIKDGDKSKINIAGLPNTTNQCVPYMEQAIAEYYNIEHYLDNVFNKIPKMPSKVLDKFGRNERNQMRKQNIELVEEDIVIREVPSIVNPMEGLDTEAKEDVVDEASVARLEVVPQNVLDVEVKKRKPRVTRKNTEVEPKAFGVKTTRKNKQ
jgi:hypothetical protein